MPDNSISLILDDLALIAMNLRHTHWPLHFKCARHKFVCGITGDITPHRSKLHTGLWLQLFSNTVSRDHQSLHCTLWKTNNSTWSSKDYDELMFAYLIPFVVDSIPNFFNSLLSLPLKSCMKKINDIYTEKVTYSDHNILEYFHLAPFPLKQKKNLEH